MGEYTVCQLMLAQRHRELRAQELDVQRQQTTLHGLVRRLDDMLGTIVLFVVFAGCAIAGAILAIGGLFKAARRKI